MEDPEYMSLKYKFVAFKQEFKIKKPYIGNKKPNNRT